MDSATKMVFPSMYIYFKTIQERISYLIFFLTTTYRGIGYHLESMQERFKIEEMSFMKSMRMTKGKPFLFLVFLMKNKRVGVIIVTHSPWRDHRDTSH